MDCLLEKNSREKITMWIEKEEKPFLCYNQ
jgi:hypothetical protein